MDSVHSDLRIEAACPRCHPEKLDPDHDEALRFNNRAEVKVKPTLIQSAMRSNQQMYGAQERLVAEHMSQQFTNSQALNHQTFLGSQGPYSCATAAWAVTSHQNITFLNNLGHFVKG